MTEQRESIFAGACPDRIAELERLTDAGEASDELFDHIDACPACSAAVGKVFKVQAAGLEELGRLIREVRAADRDDEVESVVPTSVDRVFKAILVVSTAVFGLLAVEMVTLGYVGMRDQAIGQQTRERVDVLFPGVLNGYCDANPSSVCNFGEDPAACAAMGRYHWLPFPAPTKVVCQFNTWPQPHPAYGAAFLVVDGPDIISYRYPDCPTGRTHAAVTPGNGQSQVRQPPEVGGAADECAAGPRIEVDRWRSALSGK